MSWSLSATGFPAPVVIKLREDVSRFMCQEPEQSIRANILSTIELALGAFPSDQPVKVEAFGSQSQQIDGGRVNQLQLAINPLWGFLK